MKLRKAKLKDIIKVYLWKNNIISRKMSRNQNKVKFLEHFVWYLKKLNDKESLFLIGIFNNKAFGMVRFDHILNSDNYFVSINLKPNMRGKGLSKNFLAQSLNCFSNLNKTKLYAEIRNNNTKSIKIFKSVGFVEIKKDDQFTIYEYII